MFIICAMVFIIAQTADGSYCGDVVIGCGADGDVWDCPPLDEKVVNGPPMAESSGVKAEHSE